MDHFICSIFAKRQNLTNEIEDRADEFVANTLIAQEMYNLFVETGDYSLTRIRQFCSEQNIPAYILIGRLQRDKHLEYHHYGDEKIKYELDGIEKTIPMS